MLQDIDLSHPEFFRGMKGEKPGQRLPADPEDRGQPGCTNRERQRFFELLRRGGLVVCPVDPLLLLPPSLQPSPLVVRVDV